MAPAPPRGVERKRPALCVQSSSVDEIGLRSGGPEEGGREMNCGYRLLAAALAVTAIFPCSVDTTPSFRPLHVPEKFDSAFVRGNLGIIPSTLSDKYKLIAWRYLAGLPLDKEEQEAVLAPSTVDASFQPVEDWRRACQGTNCSLVFPSTEKASRLTQGTFYINCLPDAFVTA